MDEANMKLVSKKNRANDIVLVLKAKDGKSPLNTSGVVDKRLFTGENQLHAIVDTQTMLWYLKYDQGIVPEPMKQRFTSLDKLMNFTTEYFSKRNIDIVEVQD